MAPYKVVRSPEVKDEELSEIHYHNDVDQPGISIGDLPTGTDHSTLSNVTPDQHHAREHASRHLSGGGDALTLTATEVPTSAWVANIVPALDSSYDLGSTTKFWDEAFIDNLVGPTVYNEAGNDIDFRIEGDTEVNLFFTDASTNRIGIGTATPSAMLSIAEKLLITSGGLVSKYNNVTSAGWGIPGIYAAGRSTAQAAAVASVATYTVGAADGSFVVSANVLVTTATTHNFTVTCAYTDESNTARTLTLNFSDVAGTIATAIANAGGAVPYHGIPLHIRCKAATVITIATTGTFTTVTYNVEGIIQQVA